MSTDTVKELPALLSELGVTANAVRIDHPANAPKWALDRTAADIRRRYFPDQIRQNSLKNSCEIDLRSRV